MLDFDRLKTLEEKIRMFKKIGERSDLEYYNHIRYKAYMKGMLNLKINHFQEELSAAIDAHLREMKTLLTKYSQQDRFQEYGKFISPTMFLDMKSSEDFSLFNAAYAEYRELKLVRDSKIREMRAEEERRKEERQHMDEIRYQIEEEERRRYEEKIRRLQYLAYQEQQEERLRLMEEERQRRERIQQEEKEREERRRLAIETHNREREEAERLRLQKLMEEEEKKHRDTIIQRQQERPSDEILIESDINAKMQQEFNEEGYRIYHKYGNNGVFTDTEFAGARAVYGSMGYGDDYGIDRWERIKNMYDNDGNKIKKPQVIAQGLGAGDIGQGLVGDCWFLSALSVVAYNRPDLLKNLIHEESQNYREDGLYVVRFFKMGYHKIVHVDDRFPVDHSKRSVFCKIQTEKGITEFWPVLLEKAYAKLHGSYDSLSAGRPEQGLVDLTNGISELITFDSEEFKQMKNNGSFWEKLRSSISTNLLAASSNGSSDSVKTELGIVEGHAYAVLDVEEIDGVRLIQLRNPWGDSEWTGPWSDYDDFNWTESRKRKIDARQRAKGRNPFEIGVDDGAFWMTLSDFLANYVSLSIVRLYEYPEWHRCRVTAQWKGQTAGG